MSEQEMYEDIASVDEIAEEETLDFDADLSEADDKGVETEKASINSVAAAAKKTKKAKVPGGEKSKGDQKADTISGTKAKVEEDDGLDKSHRGINTIQGVIKYQCLPFVRDGCHYRQLMENRGIRVFDLEHHRDVGGRRVHPDAHGGFINCKWNRIREA